MRDSIRGTHEFGLGGSHCLNCGASDIEIMDSVVPKACGAPPKSDRAAVKGVEFGVALLWLKDGGRAQRAGWNGKDMWIAHGKGGFVPADAFWSKPARDFAREQVTGCAEVLPYILFKTADNKILMGWLASQTDMLATDWVLLS